MIEADPTIAGNPRSDAASWSLRLLDGPLAGSTWPVSAASLYVGRGLGCQVRLDDPRVSRNHVELRAEPEGLRLRHLSERNPTFVNGAARTEAVLKAGDVIEVADFRMMIAPAAPVSDAPVLDSPTTMTLSDSLHTREYYDAASYQASPDLTGDLHALFQLLRGMSRAESLDVLTHGLREHLISRFSASDCWIAWCVNLGDELAVFPPMSAEDMRRVPMNLLRESYREGRGILPSSERGRESLAAPLVHGAKPFGAIAACRPSERGRFSKRHLDYLISVAECTAPLVRAAERMEQLRRDADARGASESSQARMLGSSPVMERLRSDLRRAANGRPNVLIVGETGVGKELAARTLHDLSPRAMGPYITVNCAAIPADLFESEMFGHERGSFTGAERSRKGMFELAHGGTLFLDEVGDLSPPNQARLLRAVETGAFRRVGAEAELRVDVRIVSATNRPLPDGSSQYFRTDLYHRLAGIEIALPPLRERMHDLPELAQHYLQEFSRHAPARPRAFNREAMDLMMAYHWPGNVRELRNVVERASYNATRDAVAAVDLCLNVGSPLTVAGAAPDSSTALEAAERRHIISVLEQTGWRVAEAAKTLGLSRSTMYYKLTRHRIDVKRRRA